MEENNFQEYQEETLPEIKVSQPLELCGEEKEDANSTLAENPEMEKEEKRLKPINFKDVMFLASLWKKKCRLLRVEGLNRQIRRSSVRMLMNTARRVKGWLKPVEVISAKEFLDRNPGYQLVDAKTGKRVKSEELTDRDFVIIDGQHRTEAHLSLQKEAKDKGETLDFDLPVKLITIPEDIEDGDYIFTVNTTATNWNHKDRTQYINAVIRDQDTGMYHANILMDEFGIGIRYATALFQMRDGFKTKMQTQFIETGKLDDFLKSTPEKIQRGLKLFESMKLGFQSRPRQIKNMAALDFAIEVFQNANDDAKNRIIDQLCAFFASLTQDEVEDMADAKTKDDRKEFLMSIWLDFSERISEESYRREHEEQAERNKFNLMLKNPYANIVNKSK